MYNALITDDRSRVTCMNKIQIKIRAQELCRIYLPSNQFMIKKRNDKIIEILMNEFQISRELAEECFNNCKEL